MTFYGKFMFAWTSPLAGPVGLRQFPNGTIGVDSSRDDSTFLAYTVDEGLYRLQAPNGRWIRFWRPSGAGVATETTTLDAATHFLERPLAWGVLAWSDDTGEWSIRLPEGMPGPSMSSARGTGGTRFDVYRRAPSLRDVQASRSAVGADFARVGEARVDLSGTDLRSVDCSRARFDGARLEGADLREATLDDARFDGATLDGTRFEGARFLGTRFVSCDLRPTRFSSPPGFSKNPARRTDLEGAWIDSATLGRDWSFLRLVDARIDGLGPETDLEGLDARSAVVTGIDLSGVRLGAADFSDADLSEARLRDVQATGSRYDRAVLRGTRFQDAVLDGASFRSVDARDAFWTRASLREARFTAAGPEDAASDLDGADLALADLSYAEMAGVRLLRAVLTGARMQGVDLTAALLGGEDRSKAASLAYAYLANATLDRANLYGVSFANATLFGASASLAETTTLVQANFSNAYLAGIHFDGAALQGSSFDGACLVNVSFRGADLSPTRSGSVATSATHALVQGADFTGADLSGVDLSNAAVAFEPGEVPVRRCNASGAIKPPPPATLPLRHPETRGLDLDTLRADTLCPNGLALRINQADGLSLEQMLTARDPRGSWEPLGCLPSTVGVEAARRDRDEPSA